MVGIRNSAYDEYTDEKRVTVGGIAPLSAQTKIGHTELFCTCSSTPWVSRNNFSFMLSDRVIVSGRFVSNSSHPRPPVTLPHLSVFFFLVYSACMRPRYEDTHSGFPVHCRKRPRCGSPCHSPWPIPTRLALDGGKRYWILI